VHGRLCPTNLGEKKANVKRNADGGSICAIALLRHNRDSHSALALLAYTFGVTRIVLAALSFVLVNTAVTAQVKIGISPEHYKKYEEIHANVENSGRNPVTLCVEVGHTSPTGEGGIQSTPSPFWVQQNNGGKWNTLLIGPDVGSHRAVTMLEPSKSMQFPFRLNVSGRMRLRLEYWTGSMPNFDCHAPPKGAKRVTSTVFTVE
jgi:hypothetical protein